MPAYRHLTTVTLQFYVYNEGRNAAAAAAAVEAADIRELLRRTDQRLMIAGTRVQVVVNGTEEEEG